MMAADDLDEMKRWFSLVATPTLIHEVISNLRKTNPLRKGQRMPLDVLRTISTFLAWAHADIPASFRKLAISSANGQHIPMNGVEVPVDSTAGNVHGNATMLIVDGTKDQELFAAWARGEFRESDDRVAQLWRDGTADLDMAAIGEQAKPFARRIAPNAKALDDVVVAVDQFMANPERDVQVWLCRTLIAFLREDPEYANRFTVYTTLKKGLLFKDFAPYAAAVARIYLVFFISLALGFVKRDSNSLADIQYLFYTPFCHVFCTNDKLQGRLFQATPGPSTLVTGDELRADLRRHREWRESLDEAGRKAYYDEYGHWPADLENSPICSAWGRAMKPRPAVPHRVTREGLDKVQNDPKFCAMVKEMSEFQAESEAAKRSQQVSWPHGEASSGERPL